MSHPERIVPDEEPPGIVSAHLKRYEFARPRCAGRAVLDAACGVGYGSAYLDEVAASVLGIDVSSAAVSYARGRYSSATVTFRQMDVESLELADGSFDVVCSFETIEHVRDPERVLAEFARVLAPGGLLVVSTPHVAVTTHTPPNPHHRVEYSRADFEALLRGRFAEVEIYGQRRLQTGSHRLAQRIDVLGLRRRVAFLRRGARLLGTAATDAMTLADLVISADESERATEIVAVCRRS